MDNPRGTRKEQFGVVISDKMQKTIIVKVNRMAKHSRYGKMVKKTNKFKAHDEKNEAKIGDKVLISETRPISKDKCWRLIKVVK